MNTKNFEEKWHCYLRAQIGNPDLTMACYYRYPQFLSGRTSVSSTFSL